MMTRDDRLEVVMNDVHVNNASSLPANDNHEIIRKSSANIESAHVTTEVKRDRSAATAAAKTATARLQVVTLNDIKNAFPKESDDESMLLDSIEITNQRTTTGTANVSDGENSAPAATTTDDDSTDQEDYDVEKGIEIPRPSLEDKDVVDRNNNGHENSRRERESLTQVEEFAFNAVGVFLSDRDDGQRRENNNETNTEKNGKDQRDDSSNGRSVSIRRSIVEAHQYVRFNFNETKKFWKRLFCYMILPSIILSLILFHGFRIDGVYYPPCSKSSDRLAVLQDALDSVMSLKNDIANRGDTTKIVTNDSTSFAPSSAPTRYDEGQHLSPYLKEYKCFGPTFSWWFLYVGARLPVTYAIACGLQFLLITCCHRNSARGKPILRLFILQAKGWPLILIFWGLVNFALMFGRNPFVKHWLFFTGVVYFDDELNKSNKFTSSTLARGIFIYMIIVGIAISLKRFFVGLQFARVSYSHYSTRLSHVLKQSKLICKVAYLSKRPISSSRTLDGCGEMSLFDSAVKRSVANLYGNGNNNSATGSIQDTSASCVNNASSDKNNMLKNSSDMQLEDMLGGWEEMIDVSRKNSERNETPSLSRIVQFGCSVEILRSHWPFSRSFGYAVNRTQVLKNSQRTYYKLIGKSDDPNNLNFKSLARAVTNKKGNFDEQELKDLMFVFRPNRDGIITLLDFCKSIDTVYKELLILRASIDNEGRLNNAAEKIVNFVFYFIVFCGAVVALGVHIYILLAALAGITLPFALCFSGAVLEFVKGLLMIIVQRPYDIGDRIAITSISEAAMAGGGSPQWLVTDVSLYHTTLVFDSSQESATVSNGSLASAKIMNGARSHRAQVEFVINLDTNATNNNENNSNQSTGMTVAHEFKSKLYDYIKSKPREWLKPVSFRTDSIQPDSSGMMTYRFAVQHRESWQQVGAIEDSKSDLRNFCFDLQRSLGFIKNSRGSSTSFTSSSASQVGFGGDDVTGDNNYRRKEETEHSVRMFVASDIALHETHGLHHETHGLIQNTIM